MNKNIKDKPKIYFYVPSQELIDKIPTTIQEYWDWIDKFIKKTPVRLPTGELCDWAGPYNWTLQTYIYLRNGGFPCKVGASFPEKGIILTHSDFLPKAVKPNASRFIVELKPDRFLKCIYSNFIIVQNKQDSVCRGLNRYILKSEFVFNWPQAGLVPRDAGRGDRFENVCYMGNPEQFLSEVEYLESEVKNIGLRWSMPPRGKWNDYSEVDAIVAVRPRNSATLNPGEDEAIFSTNRKPAAKLINAWLAGVPAILSPESAYESLRKSDMDYLKANNVREIIRHLEQLKNNIQLRREMMDHGRRRAVDFTLDKAIQRWIELIEKRIIPEYHIWTRSPVQRTLFVISRLICDKIIGIQ